MHCDCSEPNGHGRNCSIWGKKMPLKIYMPGESREPRWEDELAKVDHPPFPFPGKPPQETTSVGDAKGWDGKYHKDSDTEAVNEKQEALIHGFAGMHPEADVIKSPNHYAYGGIEAIDYIKAKLTPDEFTGYCWGNVLKYISRFNKKDGAKDLRKAEVYLKWLIEAYEKRLVFPHKVVE